MKPLILGFMVGGLIAVAIAALAHANSPKIASAGVSTASGVEMPTEAVTPSTTDSSPYTLDATTSVLLEMTNEARNVPLQENSQLMEAASYRAQYFCSHVVQHFSPDGTTPWDFFALAGYDYKDAGENLAEGYGSPVEMQDAFMASPEHYANIMNPNYTDIGLADECGNVVVLFGDK